MYNFSIIPLYPNHIDEICEDVKNIHDVDDTYIPLFIMKLIPEGTPVWDKATPLCELYSKYKRKLDAFGIKSGILIQSSLGHGWTTPYLSPFQKYVGLFDGKEIMVHCPNDEGFLEHFSKVVEKLASTRPDYIMLDDDFRLIQRPGGKGCYCPLHQKDLEKRIGYKLSREELVEHLTTHPNDDVIGKAYLDSQKDSLVNAAKRFREAIDKVDPTIQGINCTSGDNCESVIYTNKIFAGKNNPTMVRVANGSYAPLTSRGFSAYGVRTFSVRYSKLKNNGIDYVLAETDTIPFNRYGKSSRYFHSHYLFSILQGADGAKHWITRTSAYEPNAGVEYRKIYTKHNKLYKKLNELSKQIKWVGCGITFKEQDTPTYYNGGKRLGNEWNACVLERLGIPFYCTDENKGVAFMEYDIVKDLTDKQIEEYFENGSVFVDVEAGLDLIKRGFKDKLGVDIVDWGEDETPTTETYNDVGDSMQKQKGAKKLVILNDKVTPLTYNSNVVGVTPNKLAPAVTCYDRGNGKYSVTYSGTPNTIFRYTEAFSFLNETRKEQFVHLLKKANALPVYYDGDNEICLIAGYLNDNSLLVTALCLGFDPEETLNLYLEKEPTNVELFMPDGSLEKANFTKTKENHYSIDVKVEPMYPVILLIK